MDRPGDYVADATEGITRLEDLPPPHLERRRRNSRRRACPRCGCSASRCDVASRTLHDLGNVRTGRPIDIVVTYSKHRCPRCRRAFNADMSDLAVPKCHYTKRVQDLAVRLVAEDGLPYQAASWSPRRDHRAFVLRATIRNWVEAGGEEGGATGPDRAPRLGTLRLLGVHRRRRVV